MSSKPDRERLLAHYRIEQREIQRTLSARLEEIAKLNAKLMHIDAQLQKYETER